MLFSYANKFAAKVRNKSVENCVCGNKKNGADDSVPL